MERAYSSILAKSILAYNIAYHLKDLCGIEASHKVIAGILDTFEYKEPENNENQE